MQKKYLLLAAILPAAFCGLKCLAQNAVPQYAYSLKQLMPTSPESAMLGRFGDIPVSYYTGTADISIPLYTIKEGGLSIPIELKYQSSGIKVSDEATNTGLGWLMAPGGAVIQVINGMPDGQDNFATAYPTDYAYMKANVAVNGVHGARNQIGTACEYEGNPAFGDQPWEISALLNGEMQPDIYQYSLPDGTSGKFFINPETKQPVCLDKNVQIYFSTTGGWTITTLSGHKFVYGALETSFDISTTYTSNTWKLSQVVLSNGKKINFTYTQGLYTPFLHSETHHTLYPVGAPGTGYSPPLEYTNEYFDLSHDDILTNNTQTLTQISSDDVIIKFNLGDRQDIEPANNNESTLPKLVQSVDIRSAVTNRLIKTFNFNYSYFTGVSVGASWEPVSSPVPNYISQRLKLTSLQETGYDDNNNSYTNPPYQFSYDESSPLPIKWSDAVDYWGYYNGANNVNLLPDLTYLYDSGGLGDRFPYSLLTEVPTSNRAPDVTKVALGMLNKIVYPTGGSTAFTYESNCFTNYNYPDANKLSSQHQVINVSDQNTGASNSATFTLPRTATITINAFFEHGNPSNPLTFYQMQPSTVVLNKIENGTTTAIYQCQMNSSQMSDFNNGGATIKQDVNIPYDANAVYQLVANLDDNIPNQANAGTAGEVQANFTYYNVPNNTTNLSYGGGVRVSSIKNYDNNGTLTSNKILNYVNDDGSCSGILMSPLQLDYDRMMEFEYAHPIDGSSIYSDWTCDRASADIWWISSESAVPFSTAAMGNLVGYSRVEEVELANNVAGNGKNVFYYNNLASETGINTPDNPSVLNGKIKEEDSYDVNNSLLKKTIYNYVSLEDSIYMGFKGISNLVINYQPGIPINPPYCTRSFVPSYPTYTYLIYEYPLNSHWYMLSTKTSTDYYNGSGVGTTNTYTYNQIGQMTKETSIDSKNNLLSTNYVWPIDQYSAGSTTPPTLLVDSGYFDRLLEKHILNNSTEVSSEITSYNIVSNQLVPSLLQRSFKGGTLFNVASFDAYGPNKSLKQASEKDVHPYSLLYDQNNASVIAAVENTVLTDIAYTSFEVNQQGNWTIPSTTRNSFGVTGTQSYTLSNGAITKTGLTTSKTYVVSYWTTATSPLTITGTIVGFPIKGITTNGWTYYEHQVTGISTVSLSGSSIVDEVRLYPKTAVMQSYTYDPLVGMSSSVDAQNKITYYDFDGFQRLANIRDQYRNITKSYCYNYAGQMSNCSVNFGPVVSPVITSLQSSGQPRTVQVGFTSISGCVTAIISYIDLTTNQTSSSAGSCTGPQNITVPVSGDQYQFTVTCYSTAFPTGVSSAPVKILVNF